MNTRKVMQWLALFLSGLLVMHYHLISQSFLSQGDHGRDLYCFQAILQGQLPYRDFWWVYGPLMPFYYAAFYKVLGFAVSSVLVGQVILKLLAGFFFFLTLSVYIPALWAYAGALWFWAFSQDFFFTYNHTGGITVLMALTYHLCRYDQEGRRSSINGAFVCVFLLCLIKINFGLAALLITVIVFFITEYSRRRIKPRTYLFLGGAVALLLFAVAGIYLYLLQGLSVAEIRQCLPYLKTDHPYNAPFGMTVRMWWDTLVLNINSSWPNRIFALLIVTAITLTLRDLLQKKMADRRPAIMAIGLFVSFYIINMHEYWVSAVIYRTYWATPFSVLLIFLFFGLAFRALSPLVRRLILTALLVLIATRYYNNTLFLKSPHLTQHDLGLPRGRIVIGNTPEWIRTVQDTHHFLEARLGPGETFFAAPYDPIFYFLSGRLSPTRQLIFFEHINIPAAQEEKIIRSLEQKKVRYVVLSNRINSPEPGLGVFGQTYCPLIFRYINERFRPVATFGDWQNPPGWAWNLGTTVLERVENP